MNIFVRIYRKFFPKKYTLEELSQRYINELRSMGATVGENVDIINSNVDGIGGILLEIGNNVTITNARILTHDASMKKPLGYTKLAGVKIGNDCFIGADSIILPGVHIGNKVIVGAGAVVSRDIPDNSVVVGNPGRVISSYDEYIDKQSKMMNRAVCCDYSPCELLNRENSDDKSKIITDGFGYVR